MNQNEFLDLLSRFAERPVPALVGRHVYLWHDSPERLSAAAPATLLRTLDLHVLAAGLPQAPRSQDAARRLLLQGLRSQLADVGTLDRQQVIMVTGCDLLSRYHVPLTPFFEIASERTAVVLTLSPLETGFQPAALLPEYVLLNPLAPLDYLRQLVGEAAVIHSNEELP